VPGQLVPAGAMTWAMAWMNRTRRRACALPRSLTTRGSRVAGHDQVVYIGRRVADFDACVLDR
jgi:hypothetical protein